MDNETATVNGRSFTRGGNLLDRQEESLLTPLGRELYASIRDPYVLALSDVVARAEGTDFNAQPHFGYTTVIGGGVEPDFAQHPYVDSNRALIANSTASGRYQQLAYRGHGRTYAESDYASVFSAEPGFSPAVQDLVFIHSLYKRGVYRDVVERRQPAVALEVRDGNPSIPGVGTRYAPLAPEYASLENENGLGFYPGQSTQFGRRSASLPFLQQRIAARTAHTGATPATPQAPARVQFTGRLPPAAETVAELRRGRVLARGQEGTLVEELQRHLVRTGFMSQADVDTGRGVFGPRTQAAVEAFQRDRNLVPPAGFEGVVGATTWDRLVATSSPANAPVVSTSPPANGPPLGNGPPIAGSIEELSRGRVLREGARGEAVTALQRELVRTGHLSQTQVSTGPGIFGPQTKAAVEAFQRQSGTTPPAGSEGVVGQTTWQNLRNSPNGSASVVPGGVSGYIIPTTGLVTSPVGFRESTRSFHAGIDIAGGGTMTIVASASGVVDTADNNDPNGYGWKVDILHPDGLVTRYAHLSPVPEVRGGQQVRQGQRIAIVDHRWTGRGSGQHLHFEMRTGTGLFGQTGLLNPRDHMPSLVRGTRVTVGTK